MPTPPLAPTHAVLLLCACAAAFALPAAIAPAFAQQTVIYRCTDAKGAVTMQNDTPCAPGQKQEVRRIGTLPTAPAPARRAAAPAAPAGPPPGAHFELVRGPLTDPLPASAVPVAERKPPPALFECETWDKDRYLSEEGEPAPRCVPLQTVGIDGSPAMASGEACEMKQDLCAVLTGEALCRAWRRRVDEAQFRVKFAPADQREARAAGAMRMAQALADSDCTR